ncbi:MAG: amidohydrolase family protein [Clostridia bacterium]|nr:amidohydrolase family protein [Clostridia bacterium]
MKIGKNGVGAMRSMFFDVNCMIGQRFSYENTIFKDGKALLKIMDNKGIDRALVFHSLAKENFIDEGNLEVVKEAESSARLLPCWVVMPHYSGECRSPEEIVKAMSVANVKAVRIFPEYHRIKLYTWIWEELFSRLEAFKIPVLIDFSNIGWSQEIDWDGINNTCSSFPNLPVILLRQGQVADRYIYYLLDRHRNLYLETSYYQVNDGIYSIVQRFGAERLIFGTGIPVFQPDCPMSALLYSGISEKDFEKIAGKNLENLLKGVRFDDLV